MIVKKYFALLVISSFLFSNIAIAQTVSLSAEAFITLTELSKLQISPDGNRLLMLQRIDGIQTLVTRSLTERGSPSFGMPIKIGNLTWAKWVTNDVILLHIQAVYGPLGFINRTVRNTLMKVDWDGENVTRIENNKSIIDILIDDPEHILMKNSGRVFKVNINTFEEELLFIGPLKTKIFQTDKNNEIRYAVGEGGTRYGVTARDRVGHYRKPGQKQWMKIFRNNLTLGTGEVKQSFIDGIKHFAGFSNNPQIIYIFAHDENGRKSLYTFDVDKKIKLEKIISHEIYDISRVDFNKDYELDAYYYDGEYPKRIGVSKHGKRLERIFNNNFPNSFVHIESTSQDKSKIILRVTSPIEPGSYYLLDLNKNKIELIGYIYRQVDVEKLVPMQPIKYKARDGLIISGYLSMPNGSDKKNLPTIILPHDQPMRRAYWGFNYLVQYLVSQGYAVLQMNYRGSSGYGSNFQVSGFFELGGKILEDINDGTKWLIDEGYADPNKICIMGSGYGGYAALQTTIIDETSLYKCAIGYEPILDFKLYVKKLKSNYIEQRGMDLKSMSPYHRVDEFKVPLLMFKGNKLDSNNKNRYRRFTTKLEKNNNDFVYIEFEKLGTNNRAQFLKETKKFLAKHLK